MPAGNDAILETVSGWPTAPPADVVTVLQNLVQAYAFYTDEGRAEELATLFTADAEWDGTSLGYGVAHGPQDIAATVLSHHDPTRPMIHMPGPPLFVAVSSREVHGAGWCMAARSGSNRSIFFHYDDIFRLDDGQWRFQQRTLLLRFVSADG